MKRLSVSITNVLRGPSRTTFKAWEYDGLSRALNAEDNDSILKYEYDRYSSMIKEKPIVGEIIRASNMY